MDSEIQEGWIETTVNGRAGEGEISFRRSDKPGALITVKLADKTIEVGPLALLAAVKLMQPELTTARTE